MLWSQTNGSPTEATPTRRTSETDLDQFNQAMRAQPWYQAFLAKHGLRDTGSGVRLSDAQQKDLENTMRAMGIQIPGGMHIDQGGNLNQKNRLWRNVGIGAAIGGAALTGLGAAGIGPLSGLGGAAGAGAGAGATGLAANGTIPALTAATGATGVGALGAGAGGVLGGSALAGTTGAVTGLGSAVAGGVGAASAFPWGKVAQYAIPAVANVVQGYIGANAAKNAAATQSAAADRAMGTVNQLTGDERARQEQIYGGARADLTNLYNTTAQTQNQIYNSTAANYLPYQQLGAGSLNSLAAMTGGAPISAPTTFTPIAAPTFTASQQGQIGANGGNGGRTVVQNAPTSAPAQPLPTETAPQADPQQPPQAPQQQAALKSASSYQPGSLSSLAAARIRLRAPTGEEMDFSASDPNVQKALQMGAQRVA